jgi:plasmid replication initiation protein
MSNELTISKANSFVEASYQMTLDEMRVLSLTLGVFDPLNPNKRGFDFTVEEFCTHFPDVDTKSAYTQVQNAIRKISKRWVTLVDNEKELTEVVLVNKRTYFKKEGRFYIEFHEDLMPYIANLKARYTKYELVNIGAFTSTHTIRLYELCSQYKTVGYREIKLNDLKDWLQIKDKYSAYADFRKWVLEPSISEINQKSDLNVSVEPVKRGRTIYALNFVILPKQKAENDVNLTKSGRPKLPKRPEVKVGSIAEGDWARKCIKILMDWKKSGNTLTTEELEMLANRYSIIGDKLQVEEINKTIERRKQAA